MNTALMKQPLNIGISTEELNVADSILKATVSYPTAAKPPVDAERDASGRWIAPNVPMHPMSNGLVRIQFRVDQDGQAPSFRLSEFSVNKVTTVIGNDANGSITNLPGGMGVPPMILAYDCEGNLACVSNTVSGAVSLYWYDQHGRRIAKQENGLLTLYIWDGMDIIATAHADGTIREYFTRGIGIAGDVGSLVAETRFSGGTATTTYLHSNWRGDVVMATDTSGNVVGEYSYTTFGEQFSVTGTYTPRFTFSSKERDASGLVYHGFRYYSPVLCRWISEDPIRESGGFNLYQFCVNNPVNFVDPDGDFAWVLAGNAIVAGTAINFARNIYTINYGESDATTFKLFAVIPVAIMTGKNFDRRTPAAQSVILEHEIMHMKGYNELAAYTRQMHMINYYLSSGRYGEFLGEGGRDLTCEEKQELHNMKLEVEANIMYYSKPLWKRNLDRLSFWYRGYEETK